jgi:hypothetical protein
MALSELAALDAAYQALWPLDPAGRRRALQWLSDALAVDAPLAALPDDVGTPAASGINGGAPATPAADDAPRVSRRGRAAGQPRKRATSAASQPATVAASSTRTRGGRAGRTAATETAGRAKVGARRGARPYRRMPDADEVMAAYRQKGSVSALAEHFQVPVHTVQGWARQLRRHGYAIGQSR